MPIPQIITNLFPFFKSKQSDGSSYKHLGLSEANELVDYVNEEFNTAVDFESDNIERASDAWRFFTGFNNGQWDDEIISEMEKEGRNPFQGNFIRSKVEGLAGSILKNFYDVGFEPVDGDLSDMTRYMTDLMLIDKEKLDWNFSFKDFVIDGLVHLGVEEIYISDRYDPLGNIGFRRLLPGHVILDPNWLSNNSWDLKRAWKVAYLNPKQIKELYEARSEEIDYYINMRKGRITEYDNGETDKGFPHYSLNESYGDKYRVIEFKHVEREKKKIEFIVADGTIVPEGTDEYKREWAILNKVDLSDGVGERTQNIDVLYVTSICPQLSRSLVLEDKKSKIQIGRMDLFPWSSARYNGTNSGIPELLMSLQETYNKRESQIDYIIASNAAGVAMDPEIVDSNDDQMRVIQSKWNKPNFKFWTSPGALSSGRNFFQALPRNQMDFAVTQELIRMVDMADKISKQPSVMEGMSEGSEETGILYARKQLQAEVAQTILLKGLEQHLNEKGEAYMLMAKQLYSGIYRTFHVFGTNKVIELNKPVITPSGEVIENDISQLPDMKVIVSQSPEGVTNRMVDRATNLELLRVLDPQSSPIQRSRAVGNAMKTLNQSKAEKAITEQDAALEVALARESVITQLMGLKAQQLQLQQQLAMVGQPQLPVDGAPQAGGEQSQQRGEPPKAPMNPNADMQGSNMAAASMQ